MGLKDPPGPWQREPSQPRDPEVEGLEQAGRIHVHESLTGEVHVSMDRVSVPLSSGRNTQQDLTTGILMLEDQVDQADESRLKALPVGLDGRQGRLNVELQINVVLGRQGKIVLDGLS